MNIRKQIIGENMVYSGVWMVVYLIPIMNSTLMSEEYIDFSKVFLAWGKITPFFAIFLLHNQVFIRFLLRRKHYLWYIIACAVCLFTTFGIIELHERWNIATAGGYAGEYIRPRHASLTDLQWYWNMVLGTFMFIANVGIKQLYLSMQYDEDLERLKRENIQAEMYYLKYQINPHFMMNTLNNIHALIDFDGESAKKGLIELSHMMRYVTYESDGDEIPLKRDLDFITNYIELMRVRYPDNIDIRFDYPQNLSSQTVVPPLVLIVFVENAFKHGISYKAQSYIHITISLTPEHIVARFENSAFERRNQARTTGIGLDNVRKRLDLLYGNRYQLVIDDKSKDKYCVTLTLPNDDKVHSN
ncbi:MAG: histidine kinase [Alistipes sp.]|jgi:two-component sensor histidine kinase|nr:histidine kinase [Alistipes sp.]